MTRLDGKIALITGAASGIGAATVERFAAEGAVVAGLDVEPRPRASSAASWWDVDVREETAVAAAVDGLTGEHGRIDVVVNAAGVAGGGPVHLLDLVEWDRVIDINLTGTFLIAKHAIVKMLEQDTGGAIVNIASIEGLEGTEGGSVYNASKAGVVVLTKNIAIDYGRRRIRANCICPGFIDTPMTASIFDVPGMEEARQRFIASHKVGRLGRPEEIAAAAVFLASDDASFVTGHALVVDGGYTAGQSHGIVELMGLG